MQFFIYKAFSPSYLKHTAFFGGFYRFLDLLFLRGLRKSVVICKIYKHLSLSQQLHQRHKYSDLNFD